MYNKLHPSTKEKLNFRNFEAKTMTAKVYKVTPKKIKLFNEGLYGSAAEKIFLV